MELNYELELFEDMITKTLHPQNIILYPLNQEQLHDCKVQAGEEKKRIKKSFRKKMETMTSEEERMLFVHFQQECIVQLADVVTQYLPQSEWFKISVRDQIQEIEELYKFMWLQLDELLHWMKESFRKYFDLSCKIPDVRKWNAETEVRKQYLLIKNWLQHGFRVI